MNRACALLLNACTCIRPVLCTIYQPVASTCKKPKDRQTTYKKNDLQDKREGEVTAGAAQREGPKEIQCSVYGIDSSAFD
jgi:hypothetical protein